MLFFLFKFLVSCFVIQTDSLKNSTLVNDFLLTMIPTLKDPEPELMDCLDEVIKHPNTSLDVWYQVDTVALMVCAF